MINIETGFKLTPKNCLAVTLSVCLGSLSALVLALSVMALPVQPQKGLNMDASAVIYKNIRFRTGQRNRNAAATSRITRIIAGKV